MSTSNVTMIPARMCKCLQCGHTWRTTLVGYDPRICPGCRTWYWNVDPKYYVASTPKKKRRR